MRDPKPINLWTTDQVMAAGWAAEARDSDGHLMSIVANPGLVSAVKDWIAEGWTVTIFGEAAAKREAALAELHVEERRLGLE